MKSVGIFLFASVGFLNLSAAQTPEAKELSGTWRIVNPPGENRSPKICDRECTIHMDGKSLVVKTRWYTDAYIPDGKPVRQSRELSGTLFESSTAAEWDKSSFVITRTTNVGSGPGDPNPAKSKSVSRLTIRGDRLVIETVSTGPRSEQTTERYEYTRVKTD
jgi:hypothetical protein